MSKILVQSKPVRWRRINIEFNREGVELDTDKLKKGQLEILNEDSMLLVSDVEEKKAKAAK